jgi:hypothetical protein
MGTFFPMEENRNDFYFIQFWWTWQHEHNPAYIKFMQSHYPNGTTYADFGRMVIFPSTIREISLIHSSSLLKTLMPNNMPTLSRLQALGLKIFG